MSSILVQHTITFFINFSLVIRNTNNAVKSNSMADQEALSRYITELSNDIAEVDTLKKIALLCSEYPYQTDEESQSQSYLATPSPLSGKNKNLERSLTSNIWAKDTKIFGRLFEVLIQYLSTEKVSFMFKLLDEA